MRLGSAEVESEEVKSEKEKSEMRTRESLHFTFYFPFSYFRFTSPHMPPAVHAHRLSRDKVAAQQRQHGVRD